jgi:hypothetical protein
MKTRKPKQPTVTYNPEWRPDFAPRERWRCVENASRGLRIVGACHDVLKSEGRRMDHTGWHLDPWGDGETATGYVLQLPARDGEPLYVPAVADPYNADAFTVDFRCSTSDKLEAARWSDSMAESYAEAGRDYQTRDAAEQRTAEAREEITDARKTHSALARDLRTAGHSLPPSTRETVRLRMRDLFDSVRAARKRIATLADNPYSIIDGSLYR